MTALPEAVERELAELPAYFEVRGRAVMDEVILSARVRGALVHLYLDNRTYPYEPPRLELARGWRWQRQGYGRGRKIRGLDCQERWNRTLGIIALLRELEVRFREAPPERRSRRSETRPRKTESGLWRRLVDWLRAVLRRLAGWFRRRRRAAAVAAGKVTPEVIRERYDEIIADKTAQVGRYRQAVSELVRLWQQKTTRLSELREEVRRLEEAEAQALAAARREVERLEAAGKSGREIRAAAGYRRLAADYEARSAALGELRRRAEEAAADGEEHLAKVERHESQLEALVGEVEDLRAEAAEMVSDMTLTQLEREIVDVRAGISRAGGGEELEGLRRQLRKERAVVRVTREATDIENGDGDEEYLEVARKVDAARRFEDIVGLEEEPHPETAARPRNPVGSDG